jgi:hypothetical protein
LAFVARSHSELLDRIDEIVRPGVNPNPAGTSDGEQDPRAGPAAALIQ